MMIPMQWPTAHCPHGPAGSPHVCCLREGRGALGGPQCVTVCCAFAVTNGQLQQLSQTSETSSSISSYSSGPAPGAVNGLGTASQCLQPAPWMWPSPQRTGHGGAGGGNVPSGPCRPSQLPRGCQRHGAQCGPPSCCGTQPSGARAPVRPPAPTHAGPSPTHPRRRFCWH